MTPGRRRLARPARRRPAHRITCLLLLAVGLVLLAHPAAAPDSDVFSNVAPAPQLQRGSLMGAYPLSHYALDHHFSTVKAGVFSGVDVSGIPPTIAWLLAELLWRLTAFLANTLITLFTFAFSLDLVSGSDATGGAGALEPVSAAVRSIYQSTFGQPWLVAAILLAGLWAIWNALVRRRYTETAGSLALSVVFVVIALAFVTQPERTIGTASRWSNEMSGAFLSLTANGTVSEQGQAKQDAADQLFELLVYEPWVVLQFGGREHCVKTPVDPDDPQSVAVRPLSPNPGRDAELSRRLARGTDLDADGKACVNNRNKYAPRFLRYPAGSDQRDAEHDALRSGDADKLPDADAAKHDGSYRLSAADTAAADAMGKDGQYERLLMAIVILAGELGALLLLGALAVTVILAQVLVLLLMAFAPVALVVGVFPSRGHEFFLGWLSRLARFLLRKAVYSLILAVLLAVAAALADASSSLGWLMSFGLQGAFFWAVFLYRRQLAGQLTLATTGHATTPGEAALRFGSVYASARIARRLIPAPSRPPKPPPPPPPEGGGPPPDGPPPRDPTEPAGTPAPNGPEEPATRAKVPPSTGDSRLGGDRQSGSSEARDRPTPVVRDAVEQDPSTPANDGDAAAPAGPRPPAGPAPAEARADAAGQPRASGAERSRRSGTGPAAIAGSGTPASPDASLAGVPGEPDRSLQIATEGRPVATSPLLRALEQDAARIHDRAAAPASLTPDVEPRPPAISQPTTAPVLAPVGRRATPARAAETDASAGALPAGGPDASDQERRS